MKATEFIARLQQLVEEHGDLEVKNPDDDEITSVDFNHEEGYDDVFVVE